MDQDLSARQEARRLAQAAREAAEALSLFSQEKLDAIVSAVAQAFSREAKNLAAMAVEETGFGNVPDKTAKNRFASETVLEAVLPMKAVGVLRKDNEHRLWEIGVPVGVIAAIVPSTNPTSTVCYKAIIALKSGNAVVFSPHPKALRCTLQAVQIVAKAAYDAGAPSGCISCLTHGSAAGTEELMKLPQVRLILATGGPGMVRAAYSSGKPAIGVGAGNGPAYIHRSAEVKQALSCILRSKSFDNGTVCASEQSILVEKCMEEDVIRTASCMGFYFLSAQEAEKVAGLLFRPNGSLNPEIVGRSAVDIARKAGLSVPQDTKILVAREEEAGPTRPYSMEKLCPVLALYVLENEDAVLQKAVEVLGHQGSGHTFVLHAQEEDVISRFALRVPVSRFLVNTPAAQGGIGMTTGLFPALTLGCGSVGGSSSSNNISPLDLINIRRVAWGQEISQPAHAAPAADALVELVTQKILERLSLEG